MKFRKVTGEEREQLIRSRKPAGFNYHSYTEILAGLSDGEVVAVEVGDPSNHRGEKIRFSRAARLNGRSLTWLSPSNPNEIAFQVGPLKARRTREKRA